MVDVVCELKEEQVSSFVELLDRDFYIREPAVRDAVGQKACCNLIHLPTSFEIDIVVSRGRPFDAQAMRLASHAVG